MTNPKSEIQNPNWSAGLRPGPAPFARFMPGRRLPFRLAGGGAFCVRLSDFFRILDFGFRISFILFLFWFLSTLTAPAAGVRVRDLVMVSGARDNQLVGFGL